MFRKTFLAFFILLLLDSAGRSANYTWSGGSGNWQGTTLWSGSVWSDGNDAIFGRGSDSAGTVTITTTVQPSSITFNAPANGKYTITGGSIGMGSSGRTITTNADATINSALTGVGGLIKNGSGTLTLGGASTYAGGSTITAGALVLSNSNSLGTGPVYLNGGELRSGTAQLNNLVANAATTSTLNISSGELQLSSLSGSGNINCVGGGRLSFLFGDASGYSGTLTNNGDEIWLGGPLGMNLPANVASWVVNSGGLYGMGTCYLGSLSGSGGKVGGFDTDISATFVIGGNNASTVYSGQIIDSATYFRTPTTIVKVGGGTLTLNGVNTYTGGTVVSAGTLQGTADGIQGSITNNANLVFNQATAGVFNGSISGIGTMSKIGAGRLTLSSGSVEGGSIAVDGGILAAPYGLATGGVVNVAHGAVLEASGLVKRAVSGTGTITATDDLILGSSKQAGQVNLGGLPGVGGVLSIGGNAAIILSSDTAVLGSQTNLSQGGSLTTLNGAQLGNSFSLDASKVVTASGIATINGDFVNNGAVHGPTGSGQFLKFTQFVRGAGSTTGNIEYAGSYSPGNSAATVLAENVTFASTNVLIMEIGGAAAGEQYDQLRVSGEAVLDGTLSVRLSSGYSLEAGKTYDLIAGPTSGDFQQVLGVPAGWRVNYAVSGVSVTLVAEPASIALLGGGALALAGYSLRLRRRNRISGEH